MTRSLADIMTNSVWHLVEGNSGPSALTFLRKLEARLQDHFHVALTGGVLKHGRSTHDLDIVVYPHRVLPTTVLCDEYFRLGQLLIDDGHRQWVGWRDVHAEWRRRRVSDDTKIVEVWISSCDRRFDVHMPFLRPGDFP